MRLLPSATSAVLFRKPAVRKFSHLRAEGSEFFDLSQEAEFNFFVLVTIFIIRYDFCRNMGTLQLKVPILFLHQSGKQA